jgi:membrane fusion protein, multidrug efflux system
LEPDKNMTNDNNTTEKKKHGIVFKLFGLIIIIAAVLIGGHYAIRYISGRFLYETTDDAFIDGHIVSISPKISGVITKVMVDDNQHVKKGDLLVTIDPCDYQAKVNIYQAALLVAKAEVQKAKAGISSAQAQSDRAEADLKRYVELKGSSSISAQDMDNAKAAALSAKAALEVAISSTASAEAKVVQAQADLEQAKLSLSYTNIYAPLDGKVAQKHAETGSFVATGQPLMAIIAYEVWVTANFKETQLVDIHPGQKVTISVDAFPAGKLNGRVDSIQAGTGARFSLFPSENATGNYVKVIQRVPVKITFEEPKDKLKQLGLGLSVIPDVYISGKSTELPKWLQILQILGGASRDSNGDENR